MTINDVFAKHLTPVAAVLLAQAADVVGGAIPEPVKWITSISATAMLAWYLWYTASRMLPRISERHEQQIDRITEKYDGTIKEIVGNFREELALEREARREDLRAFRDMCRKGE